MGQGAAAAAAYKATGLEGVRNNDILQQVTTTSTLETGKGGSDRINVDEHLPPSFERRRVVKDTISHSCLRYTARRGK